MVEKLTHVRLDSVSIALLLHYLNIICALITLQWNRKMKQKQCAPNPANNVYNTTARLSTF